MEHKHVDTVYRHLTGEKNSEASSELRILDVVILYFSILFL